MDECNFMYIGALISLDENTKVGYNYIMKLGSRSTGNQSGISNLEDNYKMHHHVNYNL